MKPLLILSLAITLLTTTAYCTEPTAWEPQFRVDGAFRDATFQDEHLYLLAGEVAVGNPDILVLRLVEGSEPQQVGNYTARYSPLSLSAGAGWLFLTEGDRGLEVVDMRDPAKPHRAAQLALEGYSHRTVLRDDTALVASGFGGLHLVDIRDPVRPSLLSNYQAYPPPSDTGDVGAESGGLFAAEDPPDSNLHLAGPSDESGYFRADDLPAYEGLDEEISAHDVRDREGVLDVAADGSIAYLAYGSAGVVIVDISEPRNPRRVSGYQTDWPAESIAVQDGRAYVTVGVQGLLILDVTDSAKPQMLGRLRSRCYPTRVATKGDLVYLADGLCGEKHFWIINVKDPSSPHVVERLPGRIGNVRLLGDRVISLGANKTRGYSLHSP